MLMLRKAPTSSEAAAVWTRRAHALKAGRMLLTDKPDRNLWTHHEFRIWRYATAISHRLDKLQ